MRPFLLASLFLCIALLLAASTATGAEAPAASHPSLLATPAAVDRPSPRSALAAAAPFVPGPTAELMASPLRGLAAPSEQVVLNAPIEGVIKSINVKEGDAVKKGDVLAVMDDSVQQVMVNNAQLQATATGPIDRARASLDLAEQKLANTKSLKLQGQAFEWEVAQRQAERDAAAADLKTENEKHDLAAAAVVLEQARLDQFKLRAPFSGVVIRIPTKAGATLSRTDQLLSMAQLDPLEATIYLPVEVSVEGKQQILYGQLKVGQEYKVRAGSPVNRDLVAKVKVIDPVIDHASGTFRAVFTIDNKEMSMPAGFSTTLLWP